MANELSVKVKAVLIEIKDALTNFLHTGKTWTIFIDKMSLDFDERKAIRDFLGQGAVTINFKDYAEPVEWLESGIPGIWYGVFYNNNGKPILETIEICSFPELAAVNREDAERGVASMKAKLDSLQ